MKATKQWVGIQTRQWVDPGVGRRVFKNVANSVYYLLRHTRRRVILVKRKSISSDIGILYPVPKISNPNFNFKLIWRKILPLAPRNYFPYGANLDLPCVWIFPDITLGYSYLFSPLGFTRILLSWGTTCIFNINLKLTNKYQWKQPSILAKYKEGTYQRLFLLRNWY